MVSSLAEQLAALQPKQKLVGHEAGGQKQRPSLLFTASEAADLDADAIHSIGVSGLEELARQDPSLQKFEKLLFSRSSIDFQRDNQSVEVIKVSVVHLCKRDSSDC